MDRTHIGARSNLSPGIRLVSAPLLGGPRLHLRLLEHGDARFCGSGVRSFRELVEIGSYALKRVRRTKCGPNESVDLGGPITLRRATGKTRQMVAQVLDVIPDDLHHSIFREAEIAADQTIREPVLVLRKHLLRFP